MAGVSASVSVSTGEREGEPEKEGRKSREWRGVQGSLPGSSRRFGGKQEVPGVLQGQDTHLLPAGGRG
jgi:hypothetical protein